jgi:N-acetylmuramic acid 6-phosphate (MurNAc-6-P) etherase
VMAMKNIAYNEAKEALKAAGGALRTVIES